MLTRRALLRNAAGLLGGAALPSLAAAEGSRPAPQFSVFTKHLVGLPFGRVADIVAELGFSGVEAPVRKGGHVEPEAVEDGLPRLVEALRSRGLSITMLTTDINAVDKVSRTEQVLRTARALGIPRFRMKWYSYAAGRSPWAQLEEIRPRLAELVALARQIGIQPCYQNHSGAKYVGAGIWDMAGLMREHAPADLAWAFDLFHVTVEGGLSWPNELMLASERIGMAYFKDFSWKGRVPEGCPLGAGQVAPESVSRLRAAGFKGPVCLHVEYLKGSVSDESHVREAIEATRRDLDVLRRWWA
ncbi:MAG: sugar phosphate isomerase/epimerase family protein [Opitutales bacterium]